MKYFQNEVCIPQLLPDVKSSTHHTSRIPHSGIPTPSSKRPTSAGKPKQGVKNASGAKPGASPQQVVARKLLAEKVSPGSLSSVLYACTLTVTLES